MVKPHSAANGRGALADQHAVLGQPFEHGTGDRDRVRVALQGGDRAERAARADHQRRVELDHAAGVRQAGGADVVVGEVVLAGAQRDLDGVQRGTARAQDRRGRRAARSRCAPSR